MTHTLSCQGKRCLCFHSVQNSFLFFSYLDIIIEKNEKRVEKNRGSYIFHLVLHVLHVQKIVIASSAPLVCFCSHDMCVDLHFLQEIKDEELLIDSMLSDKFFLHRSDRTFCCS
jgi:hypothetical protein